MHLSKCELGQNGLTCTNKQFSMPSATSYGLKANLFYLLLCGACTSSFGCIA